MTTPKTTLQKELSQTKRFWDNYQKSGSVHCLNWWDSPIIMAHCQRLVTGNENTNVYQFLKDNLKDRQIGRGASICSGSGEFERAVIDNGLCQKIDAWELSGERIDEGRKMAQAGGYDIRFYQEDVNQASFTPGNYDIFFAWSALHHIENLEGVLSNARNSLRKGGVLVAQEYVGPNRFQWTQKQLNVINRVLAQLPAHLRTNPKTGEIKENISKPTLEHMKKTDPSEAVRSSDVIPVLRDYFDIRTLRYFGGAVFHPLFEGVLENFDPDNNTEAALLKMVLLLEELLTAEGVLQHNYALIIAEST